MAMLVFRTTVKDSTRKVHVSFQRSCSGTVDCVTILAIGPSPVLLLRGWGRLHGL